MDERDIAKVEFLRWVLGGYPILQDIAMRDDSMGYMLSDDSGKDRLSSSKMCVSKIYFTHTKTDLISFHVYISLVQYLSFVLTYYQHISSNGNA